MTQAQPSSEPAVDPAAAASPRVVVVVADGTEEIEAVVTIDLLRRAGAQVLVAGVDGAGPVRCSRGVVLVPDLALSDVDGPYEALVLPGGLEGVARLEQSEEVGARLREALDHDLYIGAICAAPRVLVRLGMFGGRAMTSHPGVREEVAAHGIYSEARVVVAGRLITSRGPGTAFDFALALARRLCGEQTALAVAEAALQES